VAKKLFRLGSGSGGFQKSDADPVKNHQDPQHCFLIDLIKEPVLSGSRIWSHLKLFGRFLHHAVVDTEENPTTEAIEATGARQPTLTPGAKTAAAAAAFTSSQLREQQ
jgi:hypothetical protein